MSEIPDDKKLSNLEVTNKVKIIGDLNLDNSSNSIQYFYLNYNATATNRWRIYVDSAVDLNFERYNVPSWVK